MKTILVDAVDCFVSDQGEIFTELHELLETYPNPKIIVTNAPYNKFDQYGLNNVPYPVFTLEHNPNKVDPEYYQKLLEHFDLQPAEVVYFEHTPAAAESAKSVGIKTYYYDEITRDLDGVKNFLNLNL